MLFNSYTFLIVFLPLVFVLYSGGGNKWKNSVLILSSIIYYAWGGVSYSVVLVFSILFNYLIGRRVSKRSKLWLTIGIIVNVSVLVLFKYTNFFIENINALVGSEIPFAPIRLPLGISFFTFHGISFLVDIYRSEKEEHVKLGETALYLSFFPQLIAGPIIRYHDIIDQIRKRAITISNLNEGIQRFIIGLFKKVVIANSMGELADQIMDVSVNDLTTPIAWVGVLAYSFQIYYDFSAYSDMAIGLGKVFGFHILENFNYPYISKNIREFWKRWHISLTNWFRDYVYIPLGGNRKGNRRTYINLISIFLLTGFWHGATWSFIFWGVFHGLFMIIERLTLGKVLERIPSFFGWIYAMLVVAIGWVFFRIADFSDAFDYAIFLFSFKGSITSVLPYFNVLNTISGLLALLFAMPLYPYLMKKEFHYSSRLIQILRFTRINIFLPIIFLYCMMILSGSSYNPFIYYQF